MMNVVNAMDKAKKEVTIYIHVDNTCGVQTVRRRKTSNFMI